MWRWQGDRSSRNRAAVVSAIPFFWRSPVSESEECRAHDFSKCELVHSPGPIPERGWRAGADGLSIWEMSVYQEAILVAERT
jgi:hypothetical protein